MSLETFLARLYSDDTVRAAFLAAPEVTAREAGLSEAEVTALANIDRAGLVMAARSYANKRAAHRRPKKKLAESLLTWIRMRSRS